MSKSKLTALFWAAEKTLSLWPLPSHVLLWVPMYLLPVDHFFHLALSPYPLSGVFNSQWVFLVYIYMHN